MKKQPVGEVYNPEHTGHLHRLGENSGSCGAAFSGAGWMG